MRDRDLPGSYRNTKIGNKRFQEDLCGKQKPKCFFRNEKLILKEKRALQ